MNTENSLYRKELELIKLQQILNEQNQQVKNSSNLQKLSVIKECFSIFDDIANTQVNFQINTDSNCPYLSISPEGGKDLMDLKDSIIDFYAKSKVTEEVKCSGVEESVSDMGASVRNNKEHLYLYHSLRKSSNIVMGDVIKESD